MGQVLDVVLALDDREQILVSVSEGDSFLVEFDVVGNVVSGSHGLGQSVEDGNIEGDVGMGVGNDEDVILSW